MKDLRDTSGQRLRSQSNLADLKSEVAFPVRTISMPRLLSLDIVCAVLIPWKSA